MVPWPEKHHIIPPIILPTKVNTRPDYIRFYPVNTKFRYYVLGHVPWCSAPNAPSQYNIWILVCPTF